MRRGQDGIPSVLGAFLCLNCEKMFVEVDSKNER